MVCNLCGKDNYRVLCGSTLKISKEYASKEFSCSSCGHGEHPQIVRCKNCGLIYSNPRDPQALIEGLYREVRDDEYLKFSRARIKTFQRALRNLHFYKSSGRLLDIGSYTGIFMKTAREKGWEVYGIEPSVWAAGIGIKEYGLNIINSSIYNAQNLSIEFDAITMWDVIEHLDDPREALRICWGRLSDKGILAISTMSCRGLFFNLCGRYWPWFMRMHLYYFTPQTINRMLKETGFKVIFIKPYVHYTSLQYLLRKFAPSLKSEVFKDIIFPVQLGDFMEVYACKEGV